MGAEAAAHEPSFNQTLTSVNDAVIRLGVIHGDFHWHKRDVEDEFFLVLEGRLLIDIEGADTVTLDPHQGYAVPRGVVHRTRAPERTVILVVEPAGVSRPATEAACDLPFVERTAISSPSSRRAASAARRSARRSGSPSSPASVRGHSGGARRRSPRPRSTAAGPAAGTSESSTMAKRTSRRCRRPVDRMLEVPPAIDYSATTPSAARATPGSRSRRRSGRAV